MSSSRDHLGAAMDHNNSNYALTYVKKAYHVDNLIGFSAADWIGYYPLLQPPTAPLEVDSPLLIRAPCHPSSCFEFFLPTCQEEVLHEISVHVLLAQ